MVTAPAPVIASLASRVAIVAAVTGVTMLGNLRSQASEIVTPTPSAQTSPIASGQRLTVRRTASSDDADANATDDEDELRLVPAIYAWDPDVRFVYFRHVSKWM